MKYWIQALFLIFFLAKNFISVFIHIFKRQILLFYNLRSWKEKNHSMREVLVKIDGMRLIKNKQ